MNVAALNSLAGQSATAIFGDCVPQRAIPTERKPKQEPITMSPTLHEAASEIVRDSIIQNKERTKSYWEQLMMAAAASNNTSSHSHSNRNSICSVESNDDGPNVKEEKRRIERELALGHVPNIPNHATMQEKIALELKQMQQREEELRIARSSSMEMKAQNLDTSNCSEYGSDESTRADSLRNRAQSMESVSSGLSLGSGSGSASNSASAEVILSDVPKRRRSVTVRPFDDPEDDQQVVPSRYANETPIEREIRLAAEREAELRRDKGIEFVKENSIKTEQNDSVVETPKESVAEVRENSEENSAPRDVQLTLATHRIEREIAEASERETQLRTMGRIKTTSIDTVDSKVIKYKDLAEITNEDKTRRHRKSIHSMPIREEAEVVPRKASLQENRKFLSNNSQRGLMQRFIASKGRMTIAQPTTPLIQRPPSPPTPPPMMTTPPTRNGFLSAEEKIQSELKEMQRREEELRLQRMHSMARSQPNLLSIMDEEELGDQEDLTPESRPLRHTSLPHFASNPNLNMNKMPTTGGRRKRFSLLEEWENRIQNL